MTVYDRKSTRNLPLQLPQGFLFEGSYRDSETGPWWAVELRVSLMGFCYFRGYQRIVCQAFRLEEIPANIRMHQDGNGFEKTIGKIALGGRGWAVNGKCG